MSLAVMLNTFQDISALSLDTVLITGLKSVQMSGYNHDSRLQYA